MSWVEGDPRPEASVAILAVDDNPNNLGSLEALLSDLGAHVVKAHSGDEALRCLLSRDFAVILLDIQMPGLDGYETAKLIRARERTRHIPIIFITAHSGTETSVSRGYALGAVDFLFKPIIGDVLKAKVSVFLEIAKKTAQIERHQVALRRAEQREHERALAQSRFEIEQQQQRRAAQTFEMLASIAKELLVNTFDDAELTSISERLAQHLSLDVFFAHRGWGPGDTVGVALLGGFDEEQRIAFEEAGGGVDLAEWVAGRHERLIALDVANANELPVGALRAAGLAAVACFPLLSQGDVVGTLAFGAKSPRALSADALGMLQTVADMLSATLERRLLVEQLEDRDRRKDEYLAMLAHELRNPLAPVRTAIELLRLKKTPAPVQVRALASADRQIAHMTRMLDDLLDVSRITKGKMELKKAPVLLSTIIEHAVQVAEGGMKTRGQPLELRLPDRPITLDVDGTRLTQVVANLLNNASKYTPPGGRITLEAERGESELVLRVTDEGIGLRPEVLARVFDLFVQIEPTSDRSQGGLGIGLTLSRRLVEMHGGTISADSAGPGQGSTFTLTFPVSIIVDDASRAETPRPVVLGDVPPLDVVLVEDNEDIRSMTRELLEMHGHTVREAADGRAGLELLLAHPPDVALLDIGLPGMDGYAVAAAFRAAPAAAKVTALVAMTGYGRAEERARALDAGFDAHVVKPVAIEALSNILLRVSRRELSSTRSDNDAHSPHHHHS